MAPKLTANRHKNEIERKYNRIKRQRNSLEYILLLLVKLLLRLLLRLDSDDDDDDGNDDDRIEEKSLKFKMLT